jgi:ceramide glucosyltransferase
VSYLLLALAAVAGIYQALVLVAALRHLRRRQPASQWTPPVSVLKPVRGLDPHFFACIRSQALQDYPGFEIVFGVSDPADPAIPEIQRLAAEFPSTPIRLIVSATRAPNGKVGVLADLAAAACHPVLVVNDSDIRVAPDYLRRVVAPLEDPRNGVVTCLYRAHAEHWPGRFEGIGIATDFAPGVLVAPLVGVSEFGLGATLAFRAGNLAQIGGFAALADYLADDYQLSRRIRGLGLRVVLSRVVVETCLPDAGWKEVWRHQLRWARTIRMSRGGGYLGLPLSNATLWSVALALAGFPWAALALFAVRLLAGLVVGAGVLQDRRTLPDFFLVPLRDLWGAALWAGGLFGTTVVWRGFRLRLSRGGRIVEAGPDRLSGY